MKIAPFFIIGLYCIALGIIVRFYYRAAKQEHEDFKFSYSIVEIWTAIVGITPTFLVLRYLNRHPQHRDIMPYEAAVLFLGQMTGIIVVKCITFSITNQFGAAGAILTGSFLGLFIPVLVLFAGALILGPVIIIGQLVFNYFPTSLVVAFPIGIVLRFWFRAATRKVHDETETAAE